MDKMNKEQYLVKLKDGLNNFATVNTIVTPQLLLIYFDSNTFLKIVPFLIFAGFIRYLFEQHVQYNVYNKHNEKDQIRYFVMITMRIALLILAPSWLIILDSIVLGILFFISSVILTTSLFINKDNIDEIVEYINREVK